MNLRNALTLAGLAAAIAIPATGSAQFYPSGYGNYYNYGPSYNYYSYPSTGYGYGYGPFGTSSYVPGPSYRYYGNSRPIRTGGVTVYFGNGGGYYGGYGSSYGNYRSGSRLYRPGGSLYHSRGRR